MGHIRAVRLTHRKRRGLTGRRGLTNKQELQRIKGLRRLARIIAVHYLANPELYAGGREHADAGSRTEIAA